MPEICEKGSDGGLLLPLFGDDEQGWPKVARGIIYFVLLCWCFLGVSIIADVFMAGIEAITSKRTQRVLSNGQTVTIRVWNATVANLTLMALGSSAPEILLNVIEILANEFYAGDLGPSTIVGSAAFNLLMIIAICVYVIPSGDSRTIKQLEPFTVTAFFSVFAYLWLILVLGLVTPDVVEPWEGVLTFLFFPLLVVLAYLADVGYFSKQKQEAKDGEADDIKATLLSAGHTVDALDAKILLKAKEEKEDLAPSRAARKAANVRPKGYDPKDISVGFVTKRYNFCESSEKLLVEMEKVGSMADELRIGVHYRTCDGSMIAHQGHYNACAGFIEIPAGSKYATATLYRDGDVRTLNNIRQEINCRGSRQTGEQSCPVGRESDSNQALVDGLDLIPAIEPYFYIELVQVCKLSVSRPPDMREDIEEEMRHNSFARINILPDFRRAQVDLTSIKAAGLLRFDTQQITIHGSAEAYVENVVVRRFNGSEGELRCKYSTEPDTAKPMYDYEHVEGELVFGPGVVAREISITILPKHSWEASDRFYIVISDAEGFEDAVEESNSILGITVSCDKAKGVANKFMRLMDEGLNLDSLNEGGVEWRDQWIAAFRPRSGDEDDIHDANAMEWTIHIIALPWKVLFAMVPPPVYCNGWGCFIVALTMIGGVTALIGDLASLLGCVVGLKPAITAITIVAVGTSLPDAFASKVAATEDPSADNAIGNVTGSNSVNVFLGIGLPWMVASLYWKANGANQKWRDKYPDISKDFPDGVFVVIAGDLVFSVIVFSLAAVTCLAVLMYRRRAFKAELGGPDGAKTLTCIFLALLWFFYIGLAIWKTLDTKAKAGTMVLAILCGMLAVVLGMVLLNAAIVACSYLRSGTSDDMKAIMQHINTQKGFSGLSAINLGDSTDEIVSRLKDHIAGLTAVVEAIEATAKRPRADTDKPSIPAFQAPKWKSVGEVRPPQFQPLQTVGPAASAGSAAEESAIQPRDRQDSDVSSHSSPGKSQPVKARKKSTPNTSTTATKSDRHEGLHGFQSGAAPKAGKKAASRPKAQSFASPKE